MTQGALEAAEHEIMKEQDKEIVDDDIYKLACMIDFHLQDNGVLVKAAIEYHQRHNSLDAVDTILKIREHTRKIRRKEY